jgi:cystathionine beta-synthase
VSVPRALRNARPCDNVLDTIGWTPLIRLNRVTDGTRTPVYAKAEFFNPGGSVKDRIGLAMIEAAERDGRLRPGRRGGGGHQREHRGGPGHRRGPQGLPLHLHHAGQDEPGEGAPAQGVRRRGHHHAHRRAARTTRTTTWRRPSGSSPARPAPSWPTSSTTRSTRGPLRHHRPRAVGPDGRPHHPLRGVRRHRRDHQRRRVVSSRSRTPTSGSSPATRWAPSSPVLRDRREGRGRAVQGGGDRQRQAPVHPLVRCHRRVPRRHDRDSFRMARRLTREEGLFVGGSAGLITHLAVRAGARLDDPDALIVTILPDTGERYLSKLYNDEWMRENRLIEPERITAAAMLADKGGHPALMVVARTRPCARRWPGHRPRHLPAPRLRGRPAASGPSPRRRSWPASSRTPGPGGARRHLMDDPLPAVAAMPQWTDIARLLTRDNPAVLVQDGGAWPGSSPGTTWSGTSARWSLNGRPRSGRGRPCWGAGCSRRGSVFAPGGGRHERTGRHVS